MSRAQRFFKAIMPRSWFAAAEEESRRWIIRCPCGSSQSIWDIGGIRWKATGKKSVRTACLACGHRGWLLLEKVPAA